jgi:hypothetical protein
VDAGVIPPADLGELIKLRNPHPSMLAVYEAVFSVFRSAWADPSRFGQPVLISAQFLLDWASRGGKVKPPFSAKTAQRRLKQLVDDGCLVSERETRIKGGDSIWYLPVRRRDDEALD